MEDAPVMRVLIVEDEKETASVLRLLLKSHLHASADIASDCTSARKLLDAEAYNLVTIDYQLPDGDGLSMISEIVSSENAPPVVMVTGHGDEQTAVSAFKHGASGYVVKDARMSTLLIEEVRSALARAAWKKAEEALARSEELYRTLVDSSPDTIAVVDFEGNVFAVSESATAMFGYSSEELWGMNVFETVSDHLRDKVPSRLKALRETGRLTNQEMVIKRKDGVDIFVEINASTIKGDGNPEKIVAVIRDVTERKRAEEALREREARLEAITEGALDAIILIDNESIIRHWNPAAESLYGYTSAEAVGQNLAIIFPEPVLTDYMIAIEDFIHSGQRTFTREGPSEVIVSGKHRSGFPAEVSLSRFQIGDEWYAELISRDISARKAADEKMRKANAELEAANLRLRQSEELLKKSESKFRSIFDTANDAIYVHDLETGQILDVNQKMCEMYKCSREEVLGRTVEDFSSGQPPFTQAEAIELIKKAGEEGPQLFEWLAKDFNGGLFWVEVNLKQANIGGEERIIAIVRDITERKRAEEQLLQSEVRFRTIAEFTYDWETWRAPDGTYIYVSPSCERISGYAPKEFLADQDLLARIAHPHDREALIAHLEAELRGKDSMHLEFRIIDRGGSERWISHFCQPVHDEDGTPLGPRASNRDITERKDAEAELARYRENLEELIRERTAELEALNARLRVEIFEREMAEKEWLRLNDELDAYARTVSHELRTPLAGVWLALEYLERISGELSNDRFDEEAKSTVIKAKATVKKADEQVRHLLELAEAGQVPTEVSDVDVSSVVTGVLSDIEGELERSGARVTAGDYLGRIQANPTHIHQIFSNLVINAIQHCDSQEPQIEVMLLGEDAGGRHRYLVRDNGSGIPPELMDQLFSPFVKGEGKGSGTGLAIVEKILKVYGGSIRAYNDDGACFEFELYDYPRSGVRDPE